MPLATSLGIGAAVAACVAFFWKIRRIPAASDMGSSERAV
jgi:hypothetical protein